MILQTALCLPNEVQTPARELSCPVPLSLVSFVIHTPGMGTSLGAPPLTVSSVAIDVLTNEVTGEGMVLPLSSCLSGGMTETFY